MEKEERWREKDSKSSKSGQIREKERPYKNVKQTQDRKTRYSERVKRGERERQNKTAKAVAETPPHREKEGGRGGEMRQRDRKHRKP